MYDGYLFSVIFLITGLSPLVNRIDALKNTKKEVIY